MELPPLLNQTGWDLQKFFFSFNHNFSHTPRSWLGTKSCSWNVLSHAFNWGLSLWVGLFCCLFPPVLPFFRIFWFLMFSLEAMSLNFYKNKEIWWWEEEKASFWLSLDHPSVDSWRSDISLSIPSCWVFLQHLTSFKASPLISIDTDGREEERSCREGKSFGIRP